MDTTTDSLSDLLDQLALDSIPSKEQIESDKYLNNFFGDEGPLTLSDVPRDEPVLKSNKHHGPLTLPDVPRDEANAIFASWHKSNKRGIGFLPGCNHDPMLVVPNRQIVPVPKFHVLNDVAKLLIKQSIDEYVVYIDSLFPNEKLYAKVGSCYQRRLWKRTRHSNGTYPKELYAHEFAIVIHALFTTNAAGEAAETYGLRYLYGKGRGLNQRGLTRPETFSSDVTWNKGANRGVIYVALSRFNNRDSFMKAYEDSKDGEPKRFRVDLDEFRDFMQVRQYKTSSEFLNDRKNKPTYIPYKPYDYYKEWNEWNDYVYHPIFVSKNNPRVETFDWCRLVGEPHTWSRILYQENLDGRGKRRIKYSKCHYCRIVYYKGVLDKTITKLSWKEKRQSKKNLSTTMCSTCPFHFCSQGHFDTFHEVSD
jgi:hypothetical protein